MKYVLLIYQPHPFDPRSLPEHEHRAIGAQYAAVTSTPNVQSGPPLGSYRDAVTVRVEGGRTVATSGPYVDGAGAIGGFMIFEADTEEEAVALASRVPAARLGGAVEVRPCSVYW